jgi:electron transfer flavoprotein beta subunit
MPFITVLVGQRPHPVSGRLGPAQGDAVALALALSLVGSKNVRVLSAGALDNTVARAYLAQGAEAIEVLPLHEGEDAAAVLARAITERQAAQPASAQDLVFTGLRAEGGLGQGTLPYALARHLRYPVMTDVVGLQAEGVAWRLTQALPKGARRQWQLVQPAVLAIHPATPVTLRHAYAAQLSGQVLHHTATAATASDVSAAAQAMAAPAWQLVPAARRLAVLEAKRAQSGHSRMLGAIGSDGASKALVLQSGSARDKAQAIFEYLQSNALVQF